MSKYVFAHFMVGNTYAYRVDDWITEINLASSHGIDGFVLNVGREEWQRDRTSDCFAAASQSGIENFKLFMSFDMSSFPAANPSDAIQLLAYIQYFARHPHAFWFKGGFAVSTFAGEFSLFGQTTLESAWIFVKGLMTEIAPIHLIPSFFIDPARYPHISAMDGAFNWNGGWPIHLKPNSSKHEVQIPKLDTDIPYINNLGKRTFMAAVSPWFFTHYGTDSWDKNFLYRGDDWLYVRRWEQLISMREHIDLVQIISWNDFGESHYIAPVAPNATQPNSQRWVDGFPHHAWLSLTRHFANAFRTGRLPLITEDKIYLWARPHPKDVVVSDPIGLPFNWELTDDTMWAVVFATAPSRVQLFTSENDRKSFDVPPGITKLSRSLKLGAGMYGVIKRKGIIVAECAPTLEEYTFQEFPETYNYNVFVASSSSEPI